MYINIKQEYYKSFKINSSLFVGTYDYNLIRITNFLMEKFIGNIIRISPPVPIEKLFK